MFASVANATQITWSYKSPAFHYGNGYSNHVLSVEQLQHNRKQEMKEKLEAEQAEKDALEAQRKVEEIRIRELEKIAENG